MEEKKILTDEELDNVVGGQKAYSKMSMDELISHKKGIAFDLSKKIISCDDYAFGGKRGAAQ